MCCRNGRHCFEHLSDVRNHCCLIGGDSLPMHFALGTGTRCVTLFTCTSPWEIYDYGLQRKIVSPLLEEFFYKRGYDERATTAITVDEVFDAVMDAARGCRRQRSLNRHTVQDERRLPERQTASAVACTRAEHQRSAVRRSPIQTRRNSVTQSFGNSQSRVALLTGGGDKPYALGMAAALTSVGIHVDFIGSDDLNVPELLGNPRVNFLNLRGDQRSEASPMAKMLRVLRYYAAAYWLCGDGKTEAVPHSVEQQVSAFRPHAVDALLQIARQEASLDRPQRERG